MIEVDAGGMDRKRNLGQFFTTKDVWLRPQIQEFIKESGCASALDPFAGGGDLLTQVQTLGISRIRGYDIDPHLLWEINDSLEKIPGSKAIIVTNPPYLAKNSAQRRHLDSVRYFEDNEYSDLYQLALEKCLAGHDHVVAIIPETYLLTELFVDRLHSVTVLETSPFESTDCPVCVVCFGPNELKYSEIQVYKDDQPLGDMLSFMNKRKQYRRTATVVFNRKDGNLGLRGVDGQMPEDRIRFCLPKDLNYDVENIKVSSRALTLIHVRTTSDIARLVDEANKIVEKYRKDTYDVWLSPFKGNNKEGKRRRRLDFQTARAIIEEALYETEK
jgi:hypothetical protein